MTIGKGSHHGSLVPKSSLNHDVFYDETRDQESVMAVNGSAEIPHPVPNLQLEEDFPAIVDEIVDEEPIGELGIQEEGFDCQSEYSEIGSLIPEGPNVEFNPKEECQEGKVEWRGLF